MTPATTSVDVRSCSLTDACVVPGCSRTFDLSQPSKNRQIADGFVVEHCTLGYFGFRVSRSLCLSSLRVPVPCIVSMTTQEQVFWVDTGGIITSVKYKLARRDGANKGLIRQPGCPLHSPFVEQIAITILVLSLRPIPATSG